MVDSLLSALYGGYFSPREALMSECEYDVREQDLDSGLYWGPYGHAFSTSRMGFSSDLDTHLYIGKEGRGADQL